MRDSCSSSLAVRAGSGPSVAANADGGGNEVFGVPGGLRDQFVSTPGLAARASMEVLFMCGLLEPSCGELGRGGSGIAGGGLGRAVAA